MVSFFIFLLQLDIEMSFTDRDKIMELIEELVVYCWPKEFDSIKLPISRLSFADAMEKYGVDSPDLRIPFQVFSQLFFIKIRDHSSSFFLPFFPFFPLFSPFF